MERSEPVAGETATAPAAPRDGPPEPFPGNVFRHAAVLYRGEAEYCRAVAGFLREAGQAAAALHVAVPRRAMRLVSETAGFPPRRAVLADMTDLGSNPARIIPAAQSFADAHTGDAVYCLWEPAWPGRTAAELREVTRHEALCNLAFAGSRMTVLCLYDAAALGRRPVADAELTHPLVTSHGHRRASQRYLGAGRFPAGSDDPLPPPTARTESLAFLDQLGRVRDFAAHQARAAGLGAERAADLVLAVSELAANALGHAAGGGLVRAWCTAAELICQVDDPGHIQDPLAGSRRRPPDASGGHGLWLVNKICDLVERRTGPSGTTTRLHMRRPVIGPRPSVA
ncbi:MAG TPA: sensor histidine kinase [Streptosporangiaceae bacterium]|jgi:anti-sigma regulatory factor (Ser/Thr protein kinase)